MKNKIKLTFVMPMYNSESYLERTLDSVEEMVDTNDIEVLLIDDGSTDKTLEIAEKYENKFDYIKFFKLKHCGVSNARNFGISKARGEYITFIDSDDTFECNFTSKFSKLFSLEADLIITDSELETNINYSVLDDDKKIYLYKYVNRDRGNTRPGSKFFKKEMLIENGILYDTDLVISEDALFLYKTIDKATSAVISNMKFYNVQDSHTLQYYNEKILTGELKYRQKTNELFNKYKEATNYKELQKVENKLKILGFLMLVDRYYGPLYIKKEITSKKAAMELKKIANKFGYSNAFSDKRHDKLLGLRHIIFRKMLKIGMYRQTIILDKFMDKIRGINRWK